MNDALQPRQELREFLEHNALPGTNIEQCLSSIDGALARFAALPAPSSVAKKARALERAARKFAAAIECVIAPEMPCKYIMRESVGSIWWLLRTADLMVADVLEIVPEDLRTKIKQWRTFQAPMQQRAAAGSSTAETLSDEIPQNGTRGEGFGDDRVERLETFARCDELGLLSPRTVRHFDSAASDEFDLLSRIRVVERQALIVNKVFSARRRPPNIKSRMLGLGLEEIWEAATGERAGYSGEATIDKPRSRFGRFVKLALATTDWALRDTVIRQILGRKNRAR